MRLPSRLPLSSRARQPAKFRNVANASQETNSVVAVLGEFAASAIAARTSAEVVLTASQSVETAVGNLRDEVENFLRNVAA